MIRSVRVGAAFAFLGWAALLGGAANAEQGASDRDLLFNTQRAAHWGLRLSPAASSLESTGAPPSTLEPAPSPATTGSSDKRVSAPPVSGRDEPPRQQAPIAERGRGAGPQARIEPPKPRIQAVRASTRAGQASRPAARGARPAPRKWRKPPPRPVPQPVPAQPVAPAAVPLLAPGHDWSGLHIGAFAGTGRGDFAFREAGVFPPSAGALAAGFAPGLALERRLEASGFIGGAQIGVGVQRGAFVLGLEGDLGWADLDRRKNAAASAGFATPSFEPVRADLDLLGTARGRAGIALGRFLVYGTAGIAAARVAGTVLEAVTAPAFGIDVAGGGRTHVGWTAGAGVEAMITPRLSAKLEYLYADVSAFRHGPAAQAAPAGGGFDHGSRARAGSALRVEAQTVKIGLNYRFSGP